MVISRFHNKFENNCFFTAIHTMVYVSSLADEKFFTILNKLIKIFIVIGFEEYEAWAVDFFPLLPK